MSDELLLFMLAVAALFVIAVLVSVFFLGGWIL